MKILEKDRKKKDQGTCVVVTTAVLNRNPESGIRKWKRNHGNGNGNGYGICERRFQAIDLKNNILAMTIK